MDAKTIEARAKAREAARTWLEMAAEDAAGLPSVDAQDAFWRALAAGAAGNATPEPAGPEEAAWKPMTDAESRAWGQGFIPNGFGKHGGERIDDVGLKYLDGLIDPPKPGSFLAELRRYLASERIKRERERSD